MDCKYVEIIFLGGGDMKNKILSFIKQNGFLLLLFIVVCLVAVYTIVVSTGDIRQARKVKDEDFVILEEMEDEPVSYLDDIILEDELEKETEAEEDLETADNTLDSEELHDEENPDLIQGFDEDISEELDESPEQQVFSEEIEFVKSDDDNYQKDEESMLIPVEGEIITEFSNDKLLYSKTLGEWRSHNGVDIRASEGTNVRAPMDGVVKEVFEDDLWGNTITIDHGNGLVSRFCNLGTIEMVKEGLNVNKGDVISVIGKSASIEMEMEPHLHFEVIRDGKFIDWRSIGK